LLRKLRKWKWIDHTPSKDSWATEKQVLSWNPQRRRRRGILSKSWSRTMEEEAGTMVETWREVKAIAGKRPLLLVE
jgi:hypothetical protein